ASVSIEDATSSALAVPPDGARTATSARPPTGPKEGAESEGDFELPLRRSRRFVPRAMLTLALGGGLLAPWQWRSSTVPWRDALISPELGAEAADGASSDAARSDSPESNGAAPEQHPAAERRRVHAPPEPEQP